MGLWGPEVGQLGVVPQAILRLGFAAKQQMYTFAGWPIQVTLSSEARLRQRQRKEMQATSMSANVVFASCAERAPTHHFVTQSAEELLHRCLEHYMRHVLSSVINHSSFLAAPYRVPT